MRKLATIRRISVVEPIEGADKICAYVVDGWKIVDAKGKYDVGELVVMCEIDSWIPHELAPFLSKGHDPREYNGVKGERLRSIKLRGQISQGLLLKLDRLKFAVETKSIGPDSSAVLRIEKLDHEGADLTEILGIQKWEAPIPVQLQGVMRGEFPTSIIPKTDQDRIQNCFDEMYALDDSYEVTIKLDGSSMTVFRLDGELRVCSRNIEFKVDENNSGNTFVKTALQIQDKIKEGYAYQGELYGENIQGNKENIKGQQFAIFDIFDIIDRRYLPSRDRLRMCKEADLEHVPVLYESAKMLPSVDDMLSMADGPSIRALWREGLVWKSLSDPSRSFKTISNKWLIKHSE